jgi:hypothetical protein
VTGAEEKYESTVGREFFQVVFRHDGATFHEFPKILTASLPAVFESGPQAPDDRHQAIDLSRREAVGWFVERGLALNEMRSIR